ncbi:hypothetical protein [Halopiger goleimassiliensis]|uniref:hypothetical protein n=1 Tax=Halopiger goleimassiliensis TaxID=1293048 RepID=UPI0012B55FED|nr:hypothetical protein [Halopiger goleimassiliensis]
MNRRRVLFGTVVVASSIAGCLDEGSDDAPGSETSPDGDTGGQATSESEGGEGGETNEVESDVPEPARDAGEGIIEAVANDDLETAASYGPVEVVEDADREGLRSAYDRFNRPEAVHAIAFSSGETEESLAEELDAEAAISAVYRLEYDVEFQTQQGRYERPVEVYAIEVDGEWSTWIERDGWRLHTRPDATVDVSGDGTTAEVELTDASERTAAFVRGGDIADPSDYRLDEPGDALEVAASEVGSGSFEVVASIEGPNSETAVVLETFSIADPSGWSDVREIVLEGEITGWIGVEPAPVEGVENPTLVLREGMEYTITVENRDGNIHVLELQDEAGERVGTYRTDEFEDAGERREITVTATDELARYVCLPHETMQHGEIVVVDSFDG